MPLDREEIIKKELEYFNSDLAKYPAFILGTYDDEYNDYSENRCVYKTEDNKKCAVGALLKPTLYEDRFDESDGVGVRGLGDNVLDYLGRENIDWLSSLQATHDECARVWHKDHEDSTYTENPHFGKYFLAVAKEQNLLS